MIVLAIVCSGVQLRSMDANTELDFDDADPSLQSMQSSMR